MNSVYLVPMECSFQIPQPTNYGNGMMSLQLALTEAPSLGGHVPLLLGSKSNCAETPSHVEIIANFVNY